METYLTIEGLAEHLKLAEQTIRRWVLNKEIPFCKIRKVIRFRLSEIEKWIDNGGACIPASRNNDLEGCLFDEDETDGTKEETEAQEASGETGGAKQCARTGEGVNEINVTRRAPKKCFTDRNDEGGEE